MNLYLLTYNNYYNRIIKKEDNLADYLPYVIDSPIVNVNFNPNDDVNAEQIINWNLTTPDYLLAVNPTGNEIVSRWFVMDSKRLRNGQYKITLKRDVVADNFNEIIEAPCFIEKATLNNDDPAIFNNENMGFNQIKTSETLLKDETESAWVVGYVPRDSFASSTTITSTIVTDEAADFIYETKSEIPIYPYLDSTYYGKSFQDSSLQMITRIGRSDITRLHEFVYRPIAGTYGIYNYEYANHIVHGYVASSPLTIWGDNGIGKNIANNKTYFLSVIPEYTSYSGKSGGLSEDEYTSFTNKIVFISSEQKYYKVNVTRKYHTESNSINVTSGLGIEWITSLNLVCADGTPITGNPTNDGSPSQNTLSLKTTCYTYTYTLDEIIMETKTVLDSDRYHLVDSPYDMFCIPYSDSLKIYQNGTQILTANKTLAINMAIEIGHDAGSGTIYDIQLLPYCPVRYMIKADGSFDIGNSKVNFITDSTGSTNKGVILWGTTSAFTFDISHSIPVINPKVENETEIYRLTSPNFNGQFEFSAVKNGGVNFFNVDCNYKPFSPYIHINPDFKNLYGQDFNDARGLICGGDFSLPQISSAWANYELTNKNYQLSFDREIQNMEVNNYYNNLEQTIGAATSAIATGVGAGMLGGGIIGGLVAGGLSAAAGIADLAIAGGRQSEAIDYKKDQFGYNMANIKAIPASLTKTTAFTYNNKIFPILEYYTCTDVEREALINKLEYNGMTVMRIGKISDFIRPEPSYIKGKIIRITDIENGHHLLNEIANEISLGVFI